MTWLPDGRRAAGALVVLCFSVAASTIMFSELAGLLFRSEGALNLLYLLAYLLPVGGLVLVGSVTWIAWKQNRQDSPADPFAGGWSRQREDRVGQDLERRLEAAAEDWYRCEETYSVADIRERLEESVVRALKASTGFDNEQAWAALEAGTWTDDPVAAAFLSPRCGQPLGERFRGALDPGQAFHRRVDRTVAAIETLEDEQTLQPTDASKTGTQPSRCREADSRSTEEVVAK